MFLCYIWSLGLLPASRGLGCTNRILHTSFGGFQMETVQPMPEKLLKMVVMVLQPGQQGLWGLHGQEAGSSTPFSLSQNIRPSLSPSLASS